MFEVVAAAVMCPKLKTPQPAEFRPSSPKEDRPLQRIQKIRVDKTTKSARPRTGRGTSRRQANSKNNASEAVAGFAGGRVCARSDTTVEQI